MNVRTKISLKINAFFAVMIAIACVCLPTYAQAQDIKLAPLNPEFTTMINNSRRGVQKSVLQTSDGHGLGLLPSPLDLSHLVGRSSTAAGKMLGAPPSSYDLRTASPSRLTSVKDQGNYGTCWTFASYGSLESCLLLSPGETWDFSEKNIANLAGFDYAIPDGGGNAYMSAAYLARWTGPVDESSDPYPGASWSGSAGYAPVKHIQSVEIIGGRPSSLANDEIKQAVTNRGALYTTMKWAGSSAGSVNYNASTHSYYYTSLAYDGHAVAIVGWDDTYSSANFASTPAGNGAFIVKNSWGTGWGDAGYFYVSYYDPHFARSENFMFLNAESTNLYTQVYQYDPLGWVTTLGYDTATAWGANIFTVTNSGDLGAVSFYATSTNASYEIFVYSGVTAGQPRSGSLRIDQTGSLTNAGYYTITLTNAISLNVGNVFSIAVKFTTPSYGYPIPMEYALSGYSSRASASLGQSYFSSDGSAWSDATTGWDPTANVCIKAFLRPAVVTPTSTVTFDPQSGSVSPTSATVTNGMTYGTLPTPTRAGYTFGGWWTETLGAGTQVTSATTVTATAAHTLYAKWTGNTGTLQFSAFSASVNENAGNATLTATRSGGSSGAASVNYATANGTAIAGTDYTATSGTLNWADGNSDSKTITVSIINRSGTQTSRAFTVGMSGASGASLGSPTSITVTIDDVLTPPSAPTGVSASDGTFTDKVSVAWTRVSGVTSYQIFRYTSNNSASTDQIGTATSTTYDDTGAVAGTTYYYWVKAVNAVGASAFSSYSTGSKAAVSSAISAPENIQASDGTYTNKILVSWNSVSAATSYQVWRNVTNDSSSASNLTTTSSTTYDDTSATTAGLTLYYWVKAKNDSGVSVFSQPDAGYCGANGSSGIADLSLRGFLFQPTVLTNNAHPEVVMLVPVNNGPNNLASSGIGFDFFLSGNTVFGDGDDEWIGDYATTVSINAGAFASVIVSDAGLNGLTIPPTASGAYYVFAKVKHTSAILDPNMTNNITMRSGAIIVGAGDGAKEPVAGDFDGDGIADPCVYQESTGKWYIKLSGGGYGLIQVTGFGGEGWKPRSGDYDGDGKSDPAVYQESTGNWQIKLSASGYSGWTTTLGGLGYLPVLGDFNGGGHSDLAVYREATGYWLVILMETEAPIYFKFGQDGYVPVTGDYTGDGVTDLALYQESTGSWFLKLGGLVYALTGFGGDGWKPVGGDYDADGLEDLMLYQASTGNWMIRLSGSGYAIVTLEGFGGADYVPVSGDYDGDGLADLVLYNSATATWLIKLSSANYAQVETTF